MANKKRRLLSKNDQQNVKTEGKTASVDLSVSVDKTELALFCGGVMICAVGLVVYFMYIKPLF
ncbi:MAG: hypothetical protein LBQ18_01620 [Campylobacteraceae bacterium]|jgi:hypothetical protein|nr:hypothetical protein [Campylobacteraceae bacterium]